MPRLQLRLETLCLALLHGPDPVQSFHCHYCEIPHYWGCWARNSHALLVLCGALGDHLGFNTEPSSGTIALPLSQAHVLKTAQLPATDGGYGLYIRCGHDRLPAGWDCPAMLLHDEAKRLHIPALHEGW